MQIVKKLFFLLLTSLFLGLGSITAYASGIPVYSYDVNSGYISHRNSSAFMIYYGNSNSYNDTFQNGGWTFYLQRVWSSPSLPSGQYYTGKITVDAQWGSNGAFGPNYVALYGINTQGQLELIGWQGYYSPSNPETFTFYTNDYFTQLFFDTGNALTQYYSWDDASITINNINAKVYQLGADQQTAQNAANAAQNAQAAAQAAQQAANAVNTIVNSTLTVNAGVVQDSSGTVLSAARQARDAANQANTGINDLSNKIDSNQQALSNQLSDLKNNITNNFNNLSQFLTPSLKKISGVNGATATSGSSIRLVLDYSNATDYRYSVDGGAWSTWSPLSGNQISVPLGSPGAHTITVQVRNGNSDTAPTDQASMSVFKL